MYTVLIRKQQGMQLSETHRNVWKGYMKMDLKEICDDVD
jgi:hypothetical protein